MPFWLKFFTTGIVAKAALGFLLTAALPFCVPISIAHPRFYIIFLAIFLPTLARLLTKFVKKLSRPSTVFVLSLTDIDLFYSIQHVCQRTFFFKLFYLNRFRYMSSSNTKRLVLSFPSSFNFEFFWTNCNSQGFAIEVNQSCVIIFWKKMLYRSKQNYLFSIVHCQLLRKFFRSRSLV